MAGILSGIIAVPAGCWFVGITGLSLAVIGGEEKNLKGSSTDHQGSSTITLLFF